MFTALIIDDELDAISVLRKSLQLFCPDFTKILEATDGAQALAHLARENVDLTFLDIKLKRENGIDLYHRIIPLCTKIVFVTAYDEFAVKAFKTNALHYLLKPVEPAELEKAVVRADLRPHRLMVTNQGVREPLAFDDIVYLESDGPYTTFHLVDGRSILIAYTLKHFEVQLPANTFFRIHRSFLINLRFVDHYAPNKRQIILKNNKELPLARRQVKMFAAALANAR